MIKTGKELAKACIDVAENYKTLYVMGCFGAPMTAANKARYTQNHSYNRQASRTKKINAASADTFGFDCVCLIKGLLWGWKGNLNHTYGGAVYGSGGVPDIGADGIIGKCKDVSTNFSKIEVGELLWMKGHVGIYIGNGKAVECTPAWKGCVQITTVCNIKSGTGHTWTKHGKLPYVQYTADDTAPTVDKDKAEPAVKKGECNVILPMLAKGYVGASVKALQILLIGNKYDCGESGADGHFGYATDKAVRAYQKDNGLEIDGVVGSATWGSLLK